MRLLSTVGAAVAAILCAGVQAFAACGPGKTPAYSDVQSVSYGRTECFGKCPAYDVLFSGYGDCEYVGERYVTMPGTYQNDCSPAILKRAVATLAEHDFYKLNYDSRILVTDVPHYVISVKRCGVTTKLDWPAYQQRTDIGSLMDALDGISNAIPWHKTSDATEPTWSQ